MANWKRPVFPTVTSAYSDWLVAQNHDKAFAEETAFRFSAALGCARALGYQLAGVEESNAFDGPSLAIMEMGSLLHEDIQAAYHLAHPNALFETTGSIEDLTSGHVDIDDAEADEIVEVKTVGAYKFDLAVGLQRKGRKLGSPKGPSRAHICQGGFNAKARGRTKVRIVYITREAVSAPLGQKLGLSSTDRIAAEWLILPEVWEPIVEAELDRLRLIRQLVKDENTLPARQDFDDSGHQIIVDPDGERPFWRCNGYCQWQDRCIADGPGLIPVPVSIGAK